MLAVMWLRRTCDGGELTRLFTNRVGNKNLGSNILRCSFKSGRYLNKEEGEQVQKTRYLTLRTEIAP